MKIVFVLTQSLDSPSGLGRYGPLARELACMGHSVEVLALHYAWAQLPCKTFVESGVRVSYAGQMHVHKEGARKFYFGPGRLLLISLASTLRLAHTLAMSEADVIHLCKPQPVNALAVKLGRRGRPVFCDCDDYEAQTNRFSGKWQQWIVQHYEDDVVHYVAGLTVNTQFTLERYGLLGFPQQRIVYVPNGVERARFTKLPDMGELRRQWQINENDPLIIYVGTLGVLSHPVDLLLEAFCKVLDQLPGAKLMLVGGGEDYDTLINRTQELGIAGRTCFTGRVLPVDVPGYLAMAKVSVDPVRDNMIARARSPLKVLESLTVGVPVVTSDVGDRRMLLKDGELGVLVSPGDPQALAEGLLAILQNPTERMRMAQAAMACREQWYWDRLVSDFVQVYAAL